ncbi:hypothetical protein TrVE_jg11611 [Triparma verrucosa]|uniref:tRNA/rRNA methyltransferase SpoU type domain-containing protein n=1 Tax=Triparma verrucosa TaxID=1606542 RepID=A0A9W7B1N5_9STRA|nr:hypothetical protein TrVE_jg11611 [Triparma verrucosa]
MRTATSSTTCLHEMKEPKILEITSPSNPTIKHVVSLHQPKNRRLHSSYIVEGRRAISSLPSTLSASLTFITPSHSTLTSPLPPSAIYYKIPPSLMSKITTTSSPTTILSVYPLPPPPQTLPHFNLISNGIQDPGNLGGLIRTLSASNLDGAFTLLGDGCDPFSPRSVRSSLGLTGYSVPYLGKFKGWKEWEEYMDDGYGMNWKVLVTVLTENSESIYEVDKDVEGLVMGSEGNGIDEGLKERMRVRKENYVECYVPMKGEVESLNVGVAAGICLYEIARSKGRI